MNLLSYFENHKFPQCEHPISVNGVLAPCGHCPLCILLKKKEWIIRCLLEYAESRQGYFITLTFDNDHLDDTSYSVIQKFFDDLRAKQGSFKYYGVFERGENTFRPHFHILLFHLKLFHTEKADNEYLQKLWNRGFVQCSFINEQQIYYTVGYINKKMLQYTFFSKSEKENKDFRKDNKYQPVNFDRKYYHFQSRGLGFSHFFNHLDEIARKGFISYNNIQYSIPRAFLHALKYRRLDRYIELFGNDEQLNFEFLERIYGKNDISEVLIDYFKEKINENKQKSRDFIAGKKDSKHNELRVYSTS